MYYLQDILTYDLSVYPYSIDILIAILSKIKGNKYKINIWFHF